MGDVAKGIGSVARGVGGVAGDVISAPGHILFGQKQPDPQSMVNSVDPRLTAMRDKQINAAQDYEKNLDTYRQQQYNAATDSSRQQLAQQLAGVTKNSNSRGMLYGSYNQGRQAMATAQNQAGLAQAKSNINTDTQNTLNQLQNQALGTGININQTQQAENNAAYQMALQEQLSNNQLFGSLLAGGGAIAGGLIGRRG